MHEPPPSYNYYVFSLGYQQLTFDRLYDELVLRGMVGKKLEISKSGARTEHLSLRNMISSSTDDIRAVVLEFQAFRGVRNEYIAKELAAVDIRTGRYVFCLFTPPYERIQLHPNIRKTNSWLKKH